MVTVQLLLIQQEQKEKTVNTWKSYPSPWCNWNPPLYVMFYSYYWGATQTDHIRNNLITEALISYPLLYLKASEEETVILLKTYAMTAYFPETYIKDA